MSWLRKQRDLIGLIMVWGLLLQSLVLPMSTTAHAAMLATGVTSSAIICTTRTASAVPTGKFAPDEQRQSKSGLDCQCCHLNCRQGCASACGAGILGAFAYIVTPHSASVSSAPKPSDRADYRAAALAESQPRAPPLTS